ncbi:MAG TPA: DNA topoisomerase IB [Solirubrobacterales bacterium]|nr:DNA topoisomerase IB [Solirubrobacterales bacterium]
MIRIALAFVLCWAYAEQRTNAGSQERRRGRLRRADCAGPGIRRRRRGRGFSYENESGQIVTDEETLERIRGLVIPPAWKDVWICPDPFGHIQATGYDEAGRKQYLYHERWQQRQAERKFELVREFAAKLPKLRRAVTADLRRQGMPRERALACAVRLLDLGFFRVGGEAYAEENESFGLATVRREHVTISPKEVVFDFPAKSGQRRVQSIRDPAARRAIEAMHRRRRGPDDLLAYRASGEWVDVRSEEINDYIHERIGEEFSAKDFRTWHGTVLAAVELAAEGPARSEEAAKRAIRRAVDRVSEALGNTPAVCRASYIDPRVLDRYRDGVTIRPPAPTNGRVTAKQRLKVEREVIELVS